MRSCERKQTGSIWNGDSRWRGPRFHHQRELSIPEPITPRPAFGLRHVCHSHIWSTLRYNLPHRLPVFSQSHSVTFHPFLFYRPSCFWACLHTEHNCTGLTTHADAPRWWLVVVDMDCFSRWRQNSFGLFVNIWNEIRCRGCPENWNHSAVCKNKPQLYSSISSLRKRIHSQERSISAE